MVAFTVKTPHGIVAHKEADNLLALGDNDFAVLHSSVQLFQVKLASDHAYRACDGQGLCHYLAGSHCHVVPAHIEKAIMQSTAHLPFLDWGPSMQNQSAASCGHGIYSCMLAHVQVKWDC